MKISTIAGIGVALLFAGVSWFIGSSLYVESQCKAWGWSTADKGMCIGDLDSGKQVRLPLDYIREHSCVGPYDITTKVKTCPSHIFYSGSNPFFQKLQIHGDAVTY